MPSMDTFPNTGYPTIVSQAVFYDLKNRAERTARCPGGDNMIGELRRIFATMELTRESFVDFDDFIDEMRMAGEECLWRAARAGNTAIIDFLVRDRGVNPRARRAMFYASRARNTQAVQLLHSYGVPHLE